MENGLARHADVVLIGPREQPTTQSATASTNRRQRHQQSVGFIRLLQEIAVAANEASEVDSILQFAIEKIAAMTGWPVGHVYYVDAVASKLIPSEIWVLKNPKRFSRFRRLTRETPLAPGKGLPGRVFLSGQPAWIEDVTTDDNFPRTKAAQNLGVKAALGFPVLVGTRVEAVVEFFTDNAQKPDHQLLEILHHVGTQIGRVIERKLAEEQVKRSREQLRALSAHLQFVREEERTKISREIHDELGQVLAALKMDLSLLRRSLLQSEEPLPAVALLEEIDSMARLVDTTIQSVRRIVAELRPEVLDHLDLKAAIEWQAQEFKSNCAIDYDFHSNTGNLDIGRDTATAIFRIFQETLTNIVRHANATKVEIRFEEISGAVTLQVKDNGKGISDAQITDSLSFGLLGMKERALFLGGELQISGIPGKGTSVKLRIPLAEFNKINC